MSGKIEARLKELGIELPQPTAPLANYVPFTIAGHLVFIAGQISQWNGERRFVGKLGAGISIADGQQAARLCALSWARASTATQSTPTPAGSSKTSVRSLSSCWRDLSSLSWAVAGMPSSLRLPASPPPPSPPPPP